MLTVAEQLPLMDLDSPMRAEQPVSLEVIYRQQDLLYAIRLKVSEHRLTTVCPCAPIFSSRLMKQIDEQKYQALTRRPSTWTVEPEGT